MARALRIWLLLCVAAAAAAIAALATGSSPIALADVPRLLFSPDGSVAAEVLHDLRLPRVLAAFGTGGSLALAGALMQVLLRNPLADPYVLGVSGGAAVGALGATMAGLGAIAMQAGAFGGALVSILLVFAIAHRDLSRLAAAGAADTAPRLLLTGVMLAAGWSALVTLMLALAPEALVRGMLFWLAGDLAGADSGALPVAALAALTLAAYPFAREMNVLLRGPLVAASLGVRVGRLRRVLYVVASAASAVAVTTSGSIGFIGLVVPHALRLAIGNDQRVLLPSCALAGGTLLVLADTAARTAVAPQQLPVGVITALVGVPTFLFLLLRRGA
jgi:iron complex transport system permease protein